MFGEWSFRTKWKGLWDTAKAPGSNFPAKKGHYTKREAANIATMVHPTESFLDFQLDFLARSLLLRHCHQVPVTFVQAADACLF